MPYRDGPRREYLPTFALEWAICFNPKWSPFRQSKDSVLQQIPRLHKCRFRLRYTPQTPSWKSDKFIIQDNQNPLENIVWHFFRQPWLFLGVKLMGINSNLFSRPFVFSKPRCTLWSDSCKGQQSWSSLRVLMKHLQVDGWMVDSKGVQKYSHDDLEPT